VHCLNAESYEVFEWYCQNSLSRFLAVLQNWNVKADLASFNGLKCPLATSLLSEGSLMVLR